MGKLGELTFKKIPQNTPQKDLRQSGDPESTVAAEPDAPSDERRVVVWAVVIFHIHLIPCRKRWKCCSQDTRHFWWFASGTLQEPGISHHMRHPQRNFYGQGFFHQYVTQLYSYLVCLFGSCGRWCQRKLFVQITVQKNLVGDNVCKSPETLGFIFCMYQGQSRGNINLLRIMISGIQHTWPVTNTSQLQLLLSWWIYSACESQQTFSEKCCSTAASLCSSLIMVCIHWADGDSIHCYIKPGNDPRVHQQVNAEVVGSITTRGNCEDAGCWVVSEIKSRNEKLLQCTIVNLKTNWKGYFELFGPTTTNTVHPFYFVFLSSELNWLRLSVSVFACVVILVTHFSGWAAPDWTWQFLWGWSSRSWRRSAQHGNWLVLSIELEILLWIKMEQNCLWLDE